MTKAELIKDVAQKTGFTQKDVKAVLETVQDVTFITLRKGEEVKLMDGITLHVVRREARSARNPHTGETIMVAPKNAVKCKIGKAPKEVVNA